MEKAATAIKAKKPAPAPTVEPAPVTPTPVRKRKKQGGNVLYEVASLYGKPVRVIFYHEMKEVVKSIGSGEKPVHAVELQYPLLVRLRPTEKIISGEDTGADHLSNPVKVVLKDFADDFKKDALYKNPGRASKGFPTAAAASLQPFSLAPPPAPQSAPQPPSQ